MRAQAPRVVGIVPGSPADAAGIAPGDEILSIDGTVPRDVIDYQLLTDAPDPRLAVRRAASPQASPVVVRLSKQEGEPVGIRIESSLFDRLKTCDNKCEFCFIYQLPPGLRDPLYIKDDDYRLSFLYGNFTTLTRMKDADLERIVTQRLSPLYVSIHSTDPDLRARMLSNRKGATSLVWLEKLLGAGIEVHGQVVACPGINAGPELDRTFDGVLTRFPLLASLGVVPLGVSRYNTAPSLRPHTSSEFAGDLERIHAWQERFFDRLGRRTVFAADEYYLGAGWPFPDGETYDGYPQLENGIGMARALDDDLLDLGHGGFEGCDGAPAVGYRSRPAPLLVRQVPPVGTPRTKNRRIILTGELGARVIAPRLAAAGSTAEVTAVRNDFFGGNIGVTGLLTGDDIARTLVAGPPDADYFLPDVCMADGRFLDDRTPEELAATTGRRLNVVETSATGLLAAAGLNHD